MPEPRSSSSSQDRGHGRRRRRLGGTLVRWALLGLLAVVVVAGFTVYQAMQARDALNAANRHLNDLTTAVAAGDASAAQESLYAAQEATLKAQHNTAGPIWWLASKAPVIGDDVTAVRTVTDVVDNVAQGVLPALVDASTSMSASDLQPTNGRVPLAEIQRIAPLLVTADASLVKDLALVRTLHPDALMPQVASPVRELESKLVEASSLTARASQAATLLPPMLGADGPRTYLVMFQNNAEIRATGGIPGAVATITALHGAVSLQRQGSAGSLGTYKQPVLPLTSDENALFTGKLGVYPADITFTPDFPRTAQIAQAMWQRETGQNVDGVVSTDPVALSYLLGGTGPITVKDGQQLTADNAVQLLLNQTYLDEPNLDRQNAFFASAAQSVFAGVMGGQGDPHAVLDGIRRAADEHRTLVWSDHPAEQAQLSSTELSGALPTKATTSPHVGVYLNDGTGSKMDYYLDYDVSVKSTSCSASGVQHLQVTVAMKSTAPPEAASLPVSVIGPGFGATPGSIRTNVLLYAPVGGHVGSRRIIDGRSLISASFEHDGRAVAAQTVDLAPGQAHTLSFDVTTGPHQAGAVTVDATPGLPGTGTTQVGKASCS